MTHRTRAVLIAIALTLSGGADIPAETVQANIGGQPKVWGYVTNDATATRIVAMWQKKKSDIDLMIYGDQPPPNGIRVGMGLSKVERLEIVEIGAPGNAYTFVVVSKVSGPKTKVWFNVSTMGFETVDPASTSTASGLIYMGTLNELAAQDPFFQGMRQSFRRVQELKRSTR